MKLVCFILICILVVGHSARMLAQKSDSVSFNFDPRERQLTITQPAPEIYSFRERVQLWDNVFDDNRQIMSTCDFAGRIREDIRTESLNSITNYSTAKEWNWKVTNVKTKCKFRPSDRRLKKDYLQALWTPYEYDRPVATSYDWTLNNQNPFSRQAVRMNLMNFPRLYFALQLFSFIQIIDEFIRHIPTCYQINEQWKLSYRKEKIVLTYTY